MTNHVDDLKRLLKVAFVPMPGGQGEPVAGAGMMTAGVASGGMGGDPAAMPPGDPGMMPPGDPGMMPPGDPAAMPPGGDPMAMPPPGGDPMAGMPPEGMPPEGDPGMMPPDDGGLVQLTGNQLINLIAALKDGPTSKKPASKEASGGSGGDVAAKLDRILAHIEGGMGQPM